MTIAKRAVWRDHLNNFDEKDGPVSWEMVKYAMGDSVFGLGALLNFTLGLFGFRPTLFTRVYGDPHKLVQDALHRILRAMTKGVEAPVLTPVEQMEKTRIGNRINYQWTKHFVDNQFRVRMRSKKKEIFKRERKEVYDLGTFSVHFIQVSDKVFPLKTVQEEQL